MQRAVANRRIFPYLVGATTALALSVGFLVTIIDRRDFPNFGTGVWWAIVTLGTVGYGDVVPHTGWGRVVGSVVIVGGVTFMSCLIAIVTSYFVRTEADAKEELRDEKVDRDFTETREALDRIERRLAAIETRLGRHLTN